MRFARHSDALKAAKVRRSGFRWLTVLGIAWQFKVGRTYVVAYANDGRKLLAKHDVILGLTWPEIERYRHKCRGMNHRANISPVEVVEWIERELTSGNKSTCPTSKS